MMNVVVLPLIDLHSLLSGWKSFVVPPGVKLLRP